MDLYRVIVFIHIAAAVALLSGSVVASPAVRAAIGRARTTSELRAYLAIGRPLLVFEPSAAGIVLVTGIYLATVASFWTLGWVQVAVAFWLVNSALAGAVVKPVMNRIAAEAAAAPEGPVGSQLDAVRQSARWELAADVIAANDAAMLYVMVLKLGMTASLVAVLAANAMVAAGRRLGSRGRRVPAISPPPSSV